MDLALLSSVSAKVILLLGVSNDLRLRGDEWPLLRVVKGLSVVVATVVDEVSMVLAALRLRLAVGCAALRTCRIAAPIARSRSNAASSSLGQIWSYLPYVAAVLSQQLALAMRCPSAARGPNQFSTPRLHHK